MRMRRLRIVAGLALVALLSFSGAAVAVASSGPVLRSFPGGEISQLAIDDGPTAGSFSNLAYEYDGCGAQAGETACAWQVDVGLAGEAAELCPSTVDASRTIWSSGERSANGRVESGPEAFALRGTPGQLLCVVIDVTVSGEGEGGWPYRDGSSAVLEALVMGPGFLTPFEAAERKIIDANPPAQLQPPPYPSNFTVSPSCRALTIANMSYVFAFRKIGCRKAANLATMAHLSHTSPSGYLCANKESGGKRCWRQGHPDKYVEWHIPRATPAPGSG
jgi:ribosome modulation factor